MGDGGARLMAGFTIAPGPDKLVLIRAVGPGLAGFGVSGVVSDPQVRLFDAVGQELAANNDWSAANLADFNAVGAFVLKAGSRDAALVTTLGPGSYTAQVEGLSGGGAGLIEVYDLSGAARLTNLSTRAQVDAQRVLIISGLVVAPGTGTRRVLIRAVGPSLTNYGVAGALGDPVLTVVRSDGVQLAANNDWSAGSTESTEALEAAFAEGGAFPLARDSRDAATVVELSGGSYTVLVSGVAGSAGLALVEVYDLTPAEGNAVSVNATVATTDTSGSYPPGMVTFTRAGPLDESLSINLSVTGTAVGGVDFVNLPSTVTIPAGEESVSLDVVPYANVMATALAKTITVSIKPNGTYEIGSSPSATVTVVYTAGTLLVANLRPLGAGASTAFGTATLQLASDERSAVVNVSFSNLSSPQTSAYLRLGVPGDAGPYLFRLPNSQVENQIWDIAPTGNLSAGEIVVAIREGRVYVSIETSTQPGGELTGSFVRSNGSQTFIEPAIPPDVADKPVDDTAAARFLTQATFGPRRADVAHLRELGIAAWLDEQMAMPASSHFDKTMAEWIAVPAGGRGTDNARPGAVHRDSAWWKISLDGPDQLRQRVAFALSEVLVVSDQNATLNNWQESVANYYDLLVDGAFGNYRDLLEQVTLSPLMGIYLTYLRNAKADPKTGALPDENYAREVMQLFTIGLNELQPDGTLRLDPRGLPIATYDNGTITEMAKVFTGWSFHSDSPGNASLFRRGAPDYIQPMTLFPSAHEEGAKTIISGIELPAGQGGAADLRMTLDALFNHPNAGPFIARRLIQRLVTSNPTPAYVYRVAQAFANNGNGVRGDLGAVVRAILTDYEARSPEPLLRLSSLFRVLPPSAEDGRLDIINLSRDFSQEPVSAPSVFNFFEPDYVRPGPLAAAGLYAPEFQILTDTTAVAGTNAIYNHLFGGPSGVRISGEPLIAMAAQRDALIAELNLTLAANALSPQTLARLATAYAALPASTTAADRVRTMAYLVMTAPEAAVQR